MNLFEFEISSDRPKYLQLAEAISEEISTGNLKLNEKLPSINYISKDLKVSRETVVKAMNHLSQKGIIRSANRRGYFVQKTDVNVKVRVFLLMDKMTVFKEELYTTLYEQLNGYGEIDVYFHHHNYEMFKALITDNLQKYTHFAIVTFMKEDVSDILNMIPPRKRIILDFKESGLDGDYTMIYQDFAANVYNALAEAQPQLEKYNKIILVCSSHISLFDEWEKGLKKFVAQTGFPYQIRSEIKEEEFEKGNVYFTLRAVDDRDLVKVIKLCQKHHLNWERTLV